MLDGKEEVERQHRESIKKLNGVVERQEKELSRHLTDLEEYQETNRSLQAALDNSYKWEYIDQEKHPAGGRISSETEIWKELKTYIYIESLTSTYLVFRLMQSFF